MSDNGVLKNPEFASDEEKAGVLIHDGANAFTADLPPDPDAHLSLEERAAIVSVFSIYIPHECVLMGNNTGSQTPLEAGFETDPLGKHSRHAYLLMPYPLSLPSPHFARC